MGARAWQAWEVCYMGSGGFFRRWQKVAEKLDFTEFVGILWESVIFLI